MKNIIILVYSVLTCVLEAQGAQITGKGFSPYIKNDSSLSRMLATWDAISDALVKAQGTINGSLSLENNLIKNHKITYRNDFGSVRLIDRSCDVNSQQITCSVVIEVQNSKTQQAPPTIELKECSAKGDGIEFCYESVAGSYKGSTFGYTSAVQTHVQVRFKLNGINHVLYTETIVSTGLGETEAQSFQSGIVQAQIKIRKQISRWSQAYYSYQDLQLLVIGRGMDKRLEIYLKLMGAHTFELNGKRYILLPSVIAKS